MTPAPLLRNVIVPVLLLVGTIGCDEETAYIGEVHTIRGGERVVLIHDSP